MRPSYRDAARHVSTEVSRHLRKSQFVDLTVHITTKRGLNIPLKPRRYNLLPYTYREFCSNHVPFYTFSINSKT